MRKNRVYKKPEMIGFSPWLSDVRGESNPNPCGTDDDHEWCDVNDGYQCTGLDG